MCTELTAFRIWVNQFLYDLRKLAPRPSDAGRRPLQAAVRCKNTFGASPSHAADSRGGLCAADALGGLARNTHRANQIAIRDAGGIERLPVQ